MTNTSEIFIYVTQILHRAPTLSSNVLYRQYELDSYFDVNLRFVVVYVYTLFWAFEQ